MVRIFSNLNLPAAILILLGSLVPTLGYVTPIVYLCWLLGDDCENVRDDTELGKFINKWYYF